MKKLLACLCATMIMYAPQFDGTGPNGNGPRSGRGRGKCPNAMEKYCKMCPFVGSLQNDSIATLEAKELFLEKMLAEVKAEKARRT